MVKLRMVFIEVLHHMHMDSVAKVKIDTRRGIAMYELQKGLAITRDDACNGRSIKDWESSKSSFRQFLFSLRTAFSSKS